MNKLSQVELNECFKSSISKLSHNEKLFSLIGPKYNKATRILSLYRDQSWKRQLINYLPNINNPVCLDLACGTGDVTFRVAKKYPMGTVYGLDLTQAMLNEAIKINTLSNVKFVCKDMCNTDFENNTFDIITGSYALRNSPDLKNALFEIKRILKPGGTVAILDFSKFDNAIAQKIQYALLKFWGSLWGILLHKNPTIYSYIAESIKHHPTHTEFEKIIKEFNFEITNKKKFFLGTMEIIIFKN